MSSLFSQVIFSTGVQNVTDREKMSKLLRICVTMGMQECNGMQTSGDGEKLVPLKFQPYLKQLAALDQGETSARSSDRSTMAEEPGSARSSSSTVLSTPRQIVPKKDEEVLEASDVHIFQIP